MIRTSDLQGPPGKEESVSPGLLFGLSLLVEPMILKA